MAEILGAITGVGAVTIGSAPQVYDLAVKQIKKPETQLRLAHENAAFVLQTLVKYGKVINQVEYDLLDNAYWSFWEDMKTVKSLKLAIDEPPSSKWTVHNIKMVRRFSKERKIRATVSKMLDVSLEAKDLATSASEKAIYKDLNSQRPSSSSSSRSSTSNASAYPPRTLPPEITNSMISLLFNSPTASDRLASVHGTARGSPTTRAAQTAPRRADNAPVQPLPAGEAGATAENPFEPPAGEVFELADAEGEDDLGLARSQTTDTTHSRTPIIVTA
ncbi:hypothetical protein FB451DRAFT_1260130 [Mycena latifolia]|nr:hypothetical protein FB451DRAFT_1260130 [Mycena latifolia]